MIVNVGARTDIVNYYGDWMFRRFEEGFAYSRNPLFANKVNRYDLSPDKVDAVIFCSKNYSPVLPRIRSLTQRYRTYFQYTITAYGKDVEPRVPDLETSVETLKELSKIVGKNKLVWRYDPVLITERYPVERHFETFSYLAERIAPYVERCIFSFVEMYIKLQTNMPDLIPLSPQNKRVLAEGLGKIARSFSLPIQTCGDSGEYEEFGVSSSGCVTLERLGKANGCVFRDMKHTGMRRGCNCIESRDLGWYDTCPNLCKYCYANKSAELVESNRIRHDPASPILIGHLEESDDVKDGVQISYLKNDGRQISLFNL